MVDAAFTKVVMFDERLYHGNGDVNVWVIKVLARFVYEAKAAAPVGKASNPWRPPPGTLKAGIQGSLSHPGAKIIEAFISSNAPHSLYVIKGTAYQGHRYIYSNLGWANKTQIDLMFRRVTPQEIPIEWFMPIPPPGPRWQMRVHGQKANNFLFTAWRRTGRRHPALRRGRFPTILR
jgi:hypothetical protein